MAPQNAISLQMFQNKMKIIPPVLPVSLAEHLQIFKKMCFTCNNNALVAKIHITRSVLDGVK